MSWLRGNRFEAAVIKYFSEQVPDGYLQRIDGVRCFSPLSEFWFMRLRLDFLVWRGVLTKKRVGSFWPSCDGMPAYGLAREQARNRTD